MDELPTAFATLPPEMLRAILEHLPAQERLQGIGATSRELAAAARAVLQEGAEAAVVRLVRWARAWDGTTGLPDALAKSLATYCRHATVSMYFLARRGLLYRGDTRVDRQAWMRDLDQLAADATGCDPGRLAVNADAILRDKETYAELFGAWLDAMARDDRKDVMPLLARLLYLWSRADKAECFACVVAAEYAEGGPIAARVLLMKAAMLLLNEGLLGLTIVDDALQRLHVSAERKKTIMFIHFEGEAAPRFSLPPGPLSSEDTDAIKRLATRPASRVFGDGPVSH